MLRNGKVGRRCFFRSARRRRLMGISAIVAAAQAGAMISSAFAGTPDIFWTGLATPSNPTSWSNGNNWAGGIVPPANSNVVFGSGFSSGLNINIAGDNVMSSLRIDTSAAFTLLPDPAHPTQPLNLPSSFIIRSATASGTQTIAAPLPMPGTAWQISGAGALVVSGIVSGNGVLSKLGTGTLVLTGSNSFAGANLQSGTVQIGADENLGSITSALTMANGALHTETTFTINRPVNITGTGTFDSVGTLTLAGAVTGGGTLIKTGAGILRDNNVRIGAMTINAGTVTTIAGGGSLGTSSVQTLSFGGMLAAPTGALDLNDHNLVINYSGTSPLDTVRQQIKSGFAGGSWNGAGLTSSAAGASGVHKTALGYAEASTVGLSSTFDGITTDSSTVIVRYTYAGDANLDKTINTSDFTQLAAHFNQSSSTWFNGDFNYDGTVNALDFNLLASNFGQTLAAPVLGTLVPEPGLLMAMSVLMAGFVRRKK